MVEMTTSMKTLSLLEQKRLQWAKEREEMIGLCGLWGQPKYRESKSDAHKVEQLEFRKNVLPPIPTRSESEEKGPNCNRPEDESETSGYLSDSPKHLNEKERMDESHYCQESANSVWYIKQEKRNTYSTDENNDESNPSYAMDRKSYKNCRNDNWTKLNTDSWQARNTKNWWFGTPESISSDDGSRLRWGDRGVGIGHLWEPVVHQPDSRLPQLESYRPTPKWVERGLRKEDGSQKADILIIHHPDDEQYKNYSSDSQKNFLLGQNVRLTPEVIEERERKRRRALEHQNAIRQQLEDRERRRKEERLNKLREERLEEERIKREQETERLRMEEEQRRNKEKEEKEKRKEQVMKAAIEMAERKAKEEKLHQRKHVHVEGEQEEVVPVKKEKPLESSREKKYSVRTPRSKNQEEQEVKIKTSRSEKVNRQAESLGSVKMQKDSSSQFEQLRIANGVQLLNMNNLPLDGSLALMLDTPPSDSSLLLPSDGVQLALLMSPGNVSSLPFQTPSSTAKTPRGRVLTPSKFRVSDKALTSQRHKTTQTDGLCCQASLKSSSRTVPRCRKQSRRSGRASGGSDSSEKSNSLERPPAHYQCTTSSKHRSRSQPKYSINDRPKWGINRPSVQYKTQSEKDLYYQKRIRQRLKKINDITTSAEPSPKGKDDAPEGKLLHSEMRLLKCDSEEDEVDEKKKSIVLKNGFRMNSNPSTPLFVPIDTDKAVVEKKENGQDFVLELTIEPEVVENNNEGKSDGDDEEFEDTATPGSVGFVSQAQLDAIRQIASLREGLQKLHMDFSSSRSITPYSEKNE